MSRITQIVHKANPTRSMVLLLLRQFLDAKEPQLVYFLQTLWNNQGRAITYKEIREAILDGSLSPSYLEEWRQDYSRFVVEHLRPAWVDAMKQAARAYEQRYPEWYFNPYDSAVEAWCNARAAAFVVEVTETQFEALNAVVTKAAVLENMSVDELSRAIRPMVGLYHQQAVANWNYYTNLLEHGVSQKRAKDLAIRYAARQHRYRAYNIARTELAFAYNQGSYQATKQAQAKGYMGEVEKVWCTADDERVCTICGGLDGKRIAMDDDFDFNTKLATPANPTIRKVPPAHPSCRCAVMYEEISPPDISQFLNR